MIKKKILPIVIFVMFLIFVGTFYFNSKEGWSMVDAFYFTVMTLTTIGYGDLVPTTDETKIFTSVFAIIGVGVMLYLLSSVLGVFLVGQEGKLGKAMKKFRKMDLQEKEIKKLKKEIKKK
jgi:hypothetical protein